MQKELQQANSEEAALFHRWRRSHQILLKYVRSTKEIVVIVGDHFSISDCCLLGVSSNWYKYSFS